MSNFNGGLKVQAGFVELTVHGTSRKIDMNPELVIGLEAEADGTQIRTVAYNLKVEESKTMIIEAFDIIKNKRRK